MKMILKRDGRRTKFDKTKIVNAIKSAFENTEGEVYDEYAESKAKNIADYIETNVNESDKMLSVEDIQDLVEKGLMSCKKKNVAKEYILYRAERTRARELKTTFFKTVRNKVDATNVQNQNANVDERSFGGRKGEADSELMRKLALETMSDKARKNHLNNRVYIHDLDSYYVGMHNCLSCPIDDLLEKGFDTRQTDVRPVNSVSTACQLIAVIFQIQSLQQFGGVSATHIDWSLVPYVRRSFSKHMKDGLTYIEGVTDEEYINSVPSELKFDDEEANDERHKASYKYAYDMTVREIYQAIEGLMHNLNTLQSRSGNQLPFSSINYGTCTLPEGRLIIKAILDTTIKGIGKLHRTSVFPCQIFKIKKGVNDMEGTPNYDLFKLALKSTSLRLYPNYANVDWSVNQVGNDGSIDAEMSTMGKVKISPCKIFSTLPRGVLN